MKIEYYNPFSYSVTVVDKNGKKIVVPSHRRVILDGSVAPKTLGKLKIVRKISSNSPTKKTDVSTTINKRMVKRLAFKQAEKTNKTIKRNIKSGKTKKKSGNPIARRLPNKIIRRGLNTVGKKVASTERASAFYKASISTSTVPISNNVAVGILSYNRLECIKRLISSLRKHTNLSRVTVFVSDESTDLEVKNFLKKNCQDFVLIDNKQKLGIAGNSNRLLKCMSRFRYCFLLNDDVEILNNDWMHHYISASEKTGMHHFCYRQNGLIGAKNTDGTKSTKNNVKLTKIDSKPHGAVMFYTNKAFETIGYFDESWGQYGMEHVDWSNRVGLSGLQERGFFDVDNSNKFFKIHKEKSKASKIDLRTARKLYNQEKENKSRIRIEHSDRIQLPSVSYVIPVRDIGRTDAIRTVINNIRGQHFPVIDIVLIEEDNIKRFDHEQSMPIRYKLSKAKNGDHFNKSKALNTGVSLASSDKVILHDGDIMVRAGYTQKMYDLFQKFDGVHIGKDVVYFTSESTNKIITNKLVDHSLQCSSQVGYFEGGSLGCTKETYNKVGGFNEAFKGYGVEDCDFFVRLKNYSGLFVDERSETFYHLWHGRVAGWQQCHTRNKAIMDSVSRMDPRTYISILKKDLEKYE